MWLAATMLAQIENIPISPGSSLELFPVSPPQEVTTFLTCIAQDQGCSTSDGHLGPSCALENVQQIDPELKHEPHTYSISSLLNARFHFLVQMRID